MCSISAYLIQRRMARFFVEALVRYEVIEVFLEDIAHHIRVTPAEVAAIVRKPAGRRNIELIASQSGYAIKVSYSPGVLIVEQR